VLVADPDQWRPCSPREKYDVQGCTGAAVCGRDEGIDIRQQIRTNGSIPGTVPPTWPGPVPRPLRGLTSGLPAFRKERGTGHQGAGLIYPEP